MPRLPPVRFFAEWFDTAYAARRRRRAPWRHHPVWQVSRLMPGVTLDAGALIAVYRGDRVLVLLARARETGAFINAMKGMPARLARTLTRDQGT